jgi:hypothetical protein
MKLRIKGASLRLRLTQSEVRALEEQGVVEEHVPFGAQARLIYRLRRDPTARQIEALFQQGAVEIRIPETVARSWCTSEVVTLSGEQPTPEGTLRIMVEKDFACLAPRSDEDESDNFPHPEAQQGKSC